MRADIRVA